MSVVSFLFDSTNPKFRGSYGDPCIQSALTAVLSISADDLPPTCVRIGDLLLRGLASRPSAITISKVKTRTRERVQTGTAWQPEKHLFLALTWDLLANIEKQWHTTNLRDAIRLLTGNAIFSVTFTDLSTDDAVKADAGLSGATGYMGAVEIDLGNPLQRKLFLEGLIPVAAIGSGELRVTSLDSVDRIAPSWADSLPIRTEVVLGYGFGEYCHPVNYPKTLSTAGNRTLQIMRGVAKKDTHTNILRQIESLPELPINGIGDTIEIRLPADSPLRAAQIPRAKLESYALSLAHPQGKHKAKLFADLLGITAKDWEYLATQIRLGLPSAKIHTVRVSEYGFQYSAEIPVRGLNGVVLPVLTAWLSINDEPPKLVTAFVAAKGVHLPELSSDHLVIGDEGGQSERFRRVIELALQEGIEAAANCIIAPMMIEGYSDPILEGEVGWAGVHIPDGRSPIVRWLRSNKVGHKHHRRGWYIPAESGSQSVARERAFAEAVQRVLLANGFICDVEWKLD